jgi:hypothetical protein
MTLIARHAHAVAMVVLMAAQVVLCHCANTCGLPVSYPM